MPGSARRPADRGGDLAYVGLLNKREQRKALAEHARYDRRIAAQRQYGAERREERKRKAAEKHERQLNEIVGAAVRKVEREKVLTSAIKTVTAYLKLFVTEHRDDFSAEAITAAIDDDERLLA